MVPVPLKLVLEACRMKPSEVLAPGPVPKALQFTVMLVEKV